MYFSVFYCLCFVNERLADMLEDNSREEGDSNPELKEGFIILDDRGKHWKGVIVENNEDKKKACFLM